MRNDPRNANARRGHRANAEETPIEGVAAEGSGGGGRGTTTFRMVPDWLIVSGVSSRAIHVYALLAKHRNDTTGQCNPRRETLAEALRCHPNSVDPAVKELVGVGAIKVTPGHGAKRGSNSYELRFDPPSQLTTGCDLAKSQLTTGCEPNSQQAVNEREEGNENTSLLTQRRASAADATERGARSKGSFHGEPEGAQALVAFFVCESKRQWGARVPGRMKGLVASRVKELLAEGYSSEQVKAAIEDTVALSRHPSTLAWAVWQVDVEAAIDAMYRVPNEHEEAA